MPIRTSASGASCARSTLPAAYFPVPWSLIPGPCTGAAKRSEEAPCLS